MARELDAPVTVVAYATEYGELERATEALSGVELEIGIAIFLAQIAGDLGQADDRVDAAVRNRAVTVAREQLELRIDLGGETPQQAQQVREPGGFVRAGLRPDGLPERKLL